MVLSIKKLKSCNKNLRHNTWQSSNVTITTIKIIKNEPLIIYICSSISIKICMYTYTIYICSEQNSFSRSDQNMHCSPWIYINKVTIFKVKILLFKVWPGASTVHFFLIIWFFLDNSVFFFFLKILREWKIQVILQNKFQKNWVKGKQFRGTLNHLRYFLINIQVNCLKLRLSKVYWVKKTQIISKKNRICSF